MSGLIFLVEEAPEGGFAARALGTSIFTEADTLDELQDQVRDAVRCHYDDAAEGPTTVTLNPVGTDPSSLMSPRMPACPVMP